MAKGGRCIKKTDKLKVIILQKLLRNTKKGMRKFIAPLLNNLFILILETK